MLAVGAVTLLAGALRFHALSRPPEKVFDETYYASDGCLYAGEPYRECDLEDDAERSWVHPPLGKQLIAFGIDAFGNRPFGWRFAAAVAGTALVALVGILAFLLFGSALWAGVAALLAGTEHLLFVQSRIAMLDVFLALFVVLGFVLLVADRRRNMVRLEPAGEGDLSPTEAVRIGGGRPLRLLSGVAFGLAIAVKWSGVLALLGAVVLAVSWTAASARARARLRRDGASVSRGDPAVEAVGQLMAFVAVPLLAYATTWIPWMLDQGAGLIEWTQHHFHMADYHFGLDTLKGNGEPIHPYMSRAWSWLLLVRPVAYYWRGDPDCCAEILGIGSPALFWGAFLVIPYLGLVWTSRKEWQAGAILVPMLVQLLPWLAVTRPLFLFYMTPVAPFLVLGLTYPLRDLLVRSTMDRRIATVAAATVVAVCVGLFAFFWPVLAGATVPYDEWRSRIWFDGWV